MAVLHRVTVCFNTFSKAQTEPSSSSCSKVFFHIIRLYLSENDGFIGLFIDEAVTAFFQNHKNEKLQNIIFYVHKLCSRMGGLY